MNFDGKVGLGYSNKVLFLRLIVKNNFEEEISKVLYFDHILTGEVDFYDGLTVQRSGSSISYNERAIPSIYTAFYLNLKPKETKEILIRKKGLHLFNSKVFLTDISNFKLIEIEKLNTFRFYAGAILALFFYNLFIAIFLKDKNYYYYCAFIFSLFLTVLSLHGIIDFIPFGNGKTFSHYLIICSSASLITATLFTRKVIPPEKINSAFVIIFKAVIIAGIVPLVLSLTPLYDHNVWIFGHYIDIFILVGLLAMILYGIIGSIKKDELAKIYTFSWICIFTGVLTYFLSSYGIINKSWITKNSIMLGNIFQMLTLSLGLGFRVIILGKEKDEAVTRANNKERYQKLLRVLSHDVSNSLQVVQLSLKRLKKNLNYERNQEKIDRILVVADNMRNILDNVKKEQKLDVDKESIQLVKTDLWACIDSSLLICEEHLKTKAIVIDKYFEEGSQFVMAEEISLINNVFGNIFSNAIKFTPNGGMIKIKTKRVDHSIEVIICDEGNGFHSALIEKFKNNENINSTAGTEGEIGTGFGLRIIKSYIELFEGRIQLRNNNGAEFYLLFKAV